MKLYRHSVAVKGDYRFPVDMLRYDSCYPQSESDSALIESVHDYNRTGPVTVRVEKLNTSIDPMWTPDRWRSFGWSLVRGSEKTERWT